MKEIKAEEFQDTRGRPEQYPWDEWIERSLAGNVYLVLKGGVDFTCTPMSFRQYVHNIAKRRGLKAKVPTQGENDVAVLFYKPEDAE